MQARSSVPDDGELVGVTVNFGTGGDLAGTCANQGYIGDQLFYCPNRSGSYTAYRLEVVEQVGNDSYTPGHGVLLSKSRTNGTPNAWIIDPRPQDIGMIDFYRPDGTPVPVVRGDPRQLNDATFHAGTNSGSAYEYVDTFNSLHFYVLDKRRDAEGVLSYDLGVRRTTGDPFERGVSLGKAKKAATAGPPRHLLLPDHEHRRGRHGDLRLGHLPGVGDIEQRQLVADDPERVRRSAGRRDRGGPVHVALDNGRRRDAHDRDAEGDVGDRSVEDRDQDVRRARLGHDPE